ncbi:MAG TPA: hypothetical protein VGE02_14705 [Gemmatimonadales bacterium]
MARVRRVATEIAQQAREGAERLAAAAGDLVEKVTDSTDSK